ncbi:MAG: hypothetical protein Q8P67_20135 [archaeon]|nr:hypothetical protein [archaeon]
MHQSHWPSPHHHRLPARQPRASASQILLHPGQSRQESAHSRPCLPHLSQIPQPSAVAVPQRLPYGKRF